MHHTTGRKIFFTVAIVTLFCASVTFADDKAILTPLLIDLPGWTAEKPDVNALDMNGMKMSTATRDYTKGEARITAGIIIGNNTLTAGTVPETVDDTYSTESDGTKGTYGKIDGFQGYMTYTEDGKNTSIVIMLVTTDKDGAMFTFSAEGVPEKEALDLAKKFDWKKLKAETEKMLKKK